VSSEETLLANIAAITGGDAVLTGESIVDYCKDWRGRYQGEAIAVVFPADTQQVSAVVKLCAGHRVAMVPQGGNTSLCGASVPLADGTLQIIINLSRMNSIREVDATNYTMTVEAGCKLASLYEAAEQADRLFPLGLTAIAPHCEIGGNLSTNAGGIGVLRYGSGLPMHRLDKLQGNLGIPLPATTQWEIAEQAADLLQPAHDELIRQAARGEILHNDDTSMRVLTLMKENARLEAQMRRGGKKERTGIFTSSIVAVRDEQRIALFITGRQHAGENLGDVLKRRAAELQKPLQMSDASSMNPPKELETILSNCLAHARRNFVDVLESFPAECRHVIEALGKVYHHDAIARNEAMTPDQRLRFHQEKSAPVMDELQSWMTTEIEEHRVEPNSGLGAAIHYMLKRWDRFTLFLSQPAAPLDNSICERALKKAVLHRKGSLFYKTLNGARVGDLFMSLIYSAELAGANPFDYLTALLEHRDDVARCPEDWMPWNYRASLDASTPPTLPAAV